MPVTVAHFHFSFRVTMDHQEQYGLYCYWLCQSFKPYSTGRATRTHEHAVILLTNRCNTTFPGPALTGLLLTLQWLVGAWMPLISDTPECAGGRNGHENCALFG